MKIPNGRDGLSVFFLCLHASNSHQAFLPQFENSLRRHNHVGLVQALLLALAKAGKLAPAQEAAKKTMKERIEQRKARGEDMDED